MKWTVHQLYQLQHKGLKLDEQISGEEFKDVDPQIRKMSPVHVQGRADISSSKVTFHLKVSGEMTLPCSRTLVDVRYPFNVEVTETFLLKATTDYEENEDVQFVEGEIIDLMPIIKELILLEIPLQVFADEGDQQEGAPQSGKDWEVVSEEDQQNKIDPRLAGLQEFFKNKEK
ncbi:YceD family protein [Metabacillus iocasae]|uniref:DUF177 domain-containing protein n=1 Tax=Priestia iocasae TaxID=2291674 RepID=A0ABS2QQM4_9BACI|nr:DUF177 domain-containing protein [Metabacillus iocasae]MBM7701755.1 uncharacterized protein [Metabacillus iocasae]